MFQFYFEVLFFFFVLLREGKEKLFWMETIYKVLCETNAHLNTKDFVMNTPHLMVWE